MSFVRPWSDADPEADAGVWTRGSLPARHARAGLCAARRVQGHGAGTLRRSATVLKDDGIHARASSRRRVSVLAGANALRSMSSASGTHHARAHRHGGRGSKHCRTCAFPPAYALSHDNRSREPRVVWRIRTELDGHREGHWFAAISKRLCSARSPRCRDLGRSSAARISVRRRGDPANFNVPCLPGARHRGSRHARRVLEVLA